MTLKAGSRLGAYEVIEPLGAGGMGEVFKARDTRLDRIVAIKVLQSHLVTPDARQRFEREARVISSLNHPHICTLYDVGQQDGVDYLVMEYIEGESLADRLTRGALPLAETLRTSTEVVDALDRAHRQGLVHRDLKPGNIMLTKSGAKLLDFGLARATGLASASGVSSPTMSRPLTAEGSIVGTFQYMAPEQLEGKEADQRSDLFSFGAVLFEMATGRRAFEGKSQASLIASILKETPQPISAVTSVSPPALDRIAQRCLEKDPEDRYQTSRDVLLDLKWVGEAGSKAGIPASVSARRKSRERLAWGIAGLATAAVVLLAFQVVANRQHRPEPIEFLAPVPGEITFIDTPKISPDGRVIAYTASDTTGIQRLWLRPLDSMQSRRLMNTDNAGRPFWSPDCKMVAYMSDGKLKKNAIAGGPAQTLCESRSRGDGSWGRRNVILYDGSPTDSIMKVSAAGGTATPATKIDRAANETGSAWPSFLPDGRHFLFLGLTAGAESHLKVGDIESNKVIKLATGNYSRIEYVEPGFIVFARDRALLAQPFDASRLKFTGEAFPIVDDVASGGGTASNADFSTSARVLVYRGGVAGGFTQIVALDRAGNTLRRVGPLTNMYNVSLSPDGRRLATSRGDGAPDIWITDLARDVSSRFTFDAGSDVTPVWSPDGSTIRFNSDRQGFWSIYEKSSNGTSVDTKVYEIPSHGVGITDWSRDGTMVVGIATDRNQGGVFVMPTRGGTARTIVQGSFVPGDARFSPDGRYIVYSAAESETREIYIVPTEGAGKWQVSSGGGRDCRWSRDGKEIFYVALGGRLMVVDVSTTPTVTLGEPHVLYSSVAWDPDRFGGNYDVSPDGKTVYLRRREGAADLPATSVVVNWYERFRKR